jgi:deoxyribodipyrimidine photolyase-related protein
VNPKRNIFFQQIYMNFFLVFPHQLFDSSQYYSDADQIMLIESPLFFADYQYDQKMHQQKILLHRASMKFFANELKDQNKKVEYWDYEQKNLLEDVFVSLKQKNISTVKIYEVVDYTLKKRLKQVAHKHDVRIKWLQTPMFLNSTNQNQSYRSEKKRWFMADFYKFQRRRLGIFMDEDDNPVGGTWSYDEENRKKLPKKLIHDLPSIERQDTRNFEIEKKYIGEAKDYVTQNFSLHPGSIDTFVYPVSRPGAEAWLVKFFQERFELFGPYEDAISENKNWLYHSILTPMMNIGLLTPKYVIDQALSFAQNNHVPINSLEGFIRQIIGWREFMRATYQDLGVQMRNGNYWKHERKIPSSFYNGTTGIDPIDDTIKRINQYGYCGRCEIFVASK